MGVNIHTVRYWNFATNSHCVREFEYYLNILHNSHTSVVD